MAIKIFYDLETTGLDFRKHSIHQIAAIIEIDGEVVEEVDLKTRPHPKAQIEPEALKRGNVTEEQILSYPPMKDVYKTLIKILGKYIDRFNPKQKAFLMGFNSAAFDDNFLRAWFEQNGDNFFSSWFWSGRPDVMALASEYLIEQRPNMPSFKLKRVAMTLGLEVDKSKLHDGSYDVKLTRAIYRIVTGIDL